MSNFFYYLFITAAFSIGSIRIAYAQTPLSLDDAVRIGLEQNRALKISMLKAKSVGESRIKETEAERLPSLKLYGSYTRLSDIGPSIIAVPVPGVQPLSFQTYLLNNYSLRLSLLQPIFTGFRLQNIQNAAEHTSSAAQEDYKADQRGTIFTIKQQYWMLYRLQRTLDAVNKSLDESRARMVDIRSKLEKGLVLPNDTLKMQVQVSNNRLKKMQTEKDIRLASASLMNTLGLPLDEKVTLTTVANEVPPPQKSMAELIEIAKHRRSELKAIDERIEAARANVKIAKAGYWPQVSLAGNLYYADPNQRYFPVKDAFKTTWDASINLSWDVWTWNIAGLQAEQADYSVQQLQEVRKQTEEAIALEITQTYLTMQTGFAAIDIAKQAAEQARENLRIVNLQYSKGVATSLDVTSAETLTLDADINVATAITDANIGVAQMARVVGE